MILLAQRRTYGTPLDYAIIFAYFVFILAFGSYFGRYSRSTREFFFSGQRFSWWLIMMSIVATGVGTHSFMKYSQVGYQYGLSSSMAYMNDWFFMPLFMFAWLPIIYFSRVRSVPEYFERRFGMSCRLIAVIILLSYMVGYIGYNLYTLGMAAQQVLGVDVRLCILIISLVSAVYIAAGGQTAVIFTDLAQGFMLLLAGLLLFVLGLDYIALDGTLLSGLRELWRNLPLSARLPFADFNQPSNFNFVGVFWQDAVASSIMFLFINQGLIMRFMAAKSVNEGRKAILCNVLIFLPLSMLAVSNAGWILRAAVGAGRMQPPPDPSEAFVTVAEIVCHPGVFGFVLAALSAALMSTIDTLTNATAALFVYDVYQPYLARGRPDRHYLRAGRYASIATSAAGLGLGLFFVRFGTDMYKVHGEFQAVVTPPIVAAVFLGALWKRFTAAGALCAMVGGAVCTYGSEVVPAVVAPFATWLHGVQPDERGGYAFMIAMFGLVASAVIGVVVSLFTKPKPEAEIAGLCVDSVELGRRFFKGGQPNYDVGRKVTASLRLSDQGTTGPDETAAIEHAPPKQPPPAYAVVRLGPQAMSRLKAQPGDLLYVGDARWWLGGLRSLHCRAGTPHELGDVVLMHQAAFKVGNFVAGRRVRVEKIF